MCETVLKFCIGIKKLSMFKRVYFFNKALNVMWVSKRFLAKSQELSKIKDKCYKGKDPHTPFVLWLARFHHVHNR